MSVKPPFPGCEEALTKYNKLLARLKDYFFHNIELKITSSETIEAYTQVYNLINQAPQKKMQNQKKYEMYQSTLFNMFKKDLTTFSKQIRQNLVANKNASSPSDELTFYYQWFVHYTWFLRWVHKILSSIQKNNGIFSRTSLFYTGLTIMRDQIVEPMYDNIFRLIMQNLQLFKQQKLQQHIQLQFMIQLIGMCGFTKCFCVKLQKNDIGFYSFFSIHKQDNKKAEVEYQTDYFLRKFVNEYVKYLKKKYSKLSQQLMQNSTPQYVNKVSEILQKQTKAAQFFYPNTNVKNIVIRSIQQTLISNRCKQMIFNQKSGVTAMLQSGNVDALKLLYKLTRRTSQQKIFGQCFQESIQKYIFEEVLNKLSAQDEKAAKKQTVSIVVNTLYQYFLKIQKVIKAITQYIKDPYDLTLPTCHINGFQLACNKNNTVCTFLAFYCDTFLKKQPNAADLNSKQLVFKVNKMLKFLYSLDQFLKIYQKMLGIRMLYDQLKNRQLQLELINMLKTQVGVGPVAKIVAMVQDYKFTQNFNSQRANLFKMKIPFVFQITLLTSGQWPIQDQKNNKKLVPPQLLRAVEVFEYQYNQLFPGRQITWIFNYGRGVVQIKLEDDSKALLLLNNYQLLIVLLLQRKDFQPLKILQVISQIKPQDQPSFMASIMMLVKKGVLKKQGNPLKIESKNQAISINFGLKLKVPKLGCFEVPRFVQKMPAVNSQLNAQRGFIIQANIIKLMKTKRVLRYQDIVNEVIAMCKTFKAETAFVKNQIQNCIHKDYLERDPKQFNTLIYKP